MHPPIDAGSIRRIQPARLIYGDGRAFAWRAGTFLPRAEMSAGSLFLLLAALKLTDLREWGLGCKNAFLKQFSASVWQELRKMRL